MNNITNMKLPDCSICSMPFSICAYFTNKALRIPLLLHCAHPACENCVISSLRVKNFVTCLICKKVSNVASSSEENDISSQFPVDHNLVGLCFNKTNSDSIESDTQIGFIKPLNKKKIAVKSTMCNECQNERANKICLECNAPYCGQCLRKVHSAARALRGHSFTELPNESVNAEYNELDITTCSEHSSHDLEFYCEQCNATICSRCLLASHNGHNVEVLAEKNKECRRKLLESYVRVSNLQRRLLSSKKETKQLLVSNKKREPTGVEIQIRDHFLRLHALITMQQNKINNQIKMVESTASLNDIMLKLSSYIDETSEALDLAKKLLNEKLINNVNYKNILTLLNTKEVLPCHVIRDEIQDSITFTADDKIFGNLEEHCNVVIKETSQFKLVTDEDLPSGYVPKVINEIAIGDVEATIEFNSTKEEGDEKSPNSKTNDGRKKLISSLSDDVTESFSASKLSSDSSNASTGSISSSLNDLSRTIQHYDDLVPGVTVHVNISHLISPSDFYVCRIGVSKRLKELQFQLQKSIAGKFHCTISPKKIVKGSIFMTCSDSDNEWYRVRIQDIMGECDVKVHFIDFGYAKILATDSLKPVSNYIKNIPPLALRCKLADCFPINGVSWAPQAIRVMAQITNNSTDQVLITVIEKTAQFYEVQMMTRGDSYNVNIGDALTFLSLGVYSNSPRDFPVTSFNTRNLKTMPTRIEIKQDAILETFITHVINPSHFYVIIKQLGTKSSNKLVNLQSDLQHSYGNRGLNTFAMFNPQPGLHVAAKFSGDNKWYRAEVLEIPDSKLVKVFYIDFGYSEVLNWKNVKVLFSKFYKLPPQAYRCCLSDIEPLGSEEWSPESAQILREETFNAQLKMIVGAVRENTLSVVLYKLSPEADICVNALLVRNHKANSTGVNSTVVEFPKLYDMPKNENTYQCDVALENQLKKSLNTTPAPPVQINSNYFIKGRNGCLKIQVNIKRIIDPGEFYITLCYVDEEIKQLEKELQDYYSKYENIMGLVDWKVESRCAVIINEKWYRAIIQEICSEKNEIKVYIPDEGTVEIVSTECFRKLEKRFLSHRDGVSKCHLGGLLPTLGDWSKTSITEFEEFAKSNAGNLYITKMSQSEMKENSLPVELFKRTIVPPGPLEAEKDNWTSFNHYLRMIGLAKPDSVTKWDVDGNIISEDINEENKADPEALILQDILSSSFQKYESEEPILNTNMHYVAVKWLPPEPVSSLEFIGTPTYIDDDCNIYIQDFMKSTLTLSEISNVLTHNFDDTLPTPYDLRWTPGDICAAQYFVDKKWYRGIVKKLLPNDNTLIQFVDYGNFDPCPPGTLRKKPTMTHIPIQATSFKLHTIAPANADNRWYREDLDNIHSSVTTKNCRVELEIINDGYGVKRLIMGNGQDAIALWVRNKWARYSSELLSDHLYKQEKLKRSDEKTIQEDEEKEEKYLEIECVVDNKEEISDSEESISTIGNEEVCDDDDDDKEEEEDADDYSARKILLHWYFISENNENLKSICKYEQLQLPENIESLFVEVTAVLSETEIVVNISNTTDSFLLEVQDEFLQISKIMQIEAELQPTIEQPYLYKMCCTQFSADNVWYRAVVLKIVDEASLLVQYIDYGNVEVLPISQVREIKDEWVKPKAQSIVCSLAGITTDPMTNGDELMTKLNSCLTREDNLCARIKVRSLINEVELYYGDELAYQPLIDEGYLIKTSA